jgi:hydroxymethylbilane synthase
MRKIIIGSRQSKLAMTQTNWVIDQLKSLGLPVEFEIKKIVTKGDKILDVTLSKVGGKGLFVKEIEQAMIDKEIDMAVHSMKDMPAELPEGLTIGCIPKRADYRDVLISNDHVKLADLKAGAVVGTSSLRRAAQVLAARPDLEIKWIRGNVDTRLRKLKEEGYDAIILAAAGLQRLGWTDEYITEYLEVDVCLPAIGQGALSIECREDDHELIEMLQKLNDDTTEKTVKAEREFLHKIEGGCQVPVAGFAQLTDNGDIKLRGLVATPDGKTLLSEEAIGNDPIEIGIKVAESIMSKGGADILAKVKADLDKNQQ